MRLVQSALAGLLAISLCSSAFAQSRRLQSGSAGAGNFQFFHDTYLDPAVPEIASIGGGTITDGAEAVVHRFMLDASRRVYFGYDASIDVLPEPDTYRVTFSQLTMSSQSARKILGDDASSWSALPTPDWAGPAVRTVRAGEVLVLDLLTNSTTGQKIIDYVTVQSPSAQPPTSLGPGRADFVYETGTPRDLQPEDVWLDLRTPRVTINGNLVPSAILGDVSGPAPWFYVPMHGRFILSVTPHHQFRKAGEIRGSTLTFTLGDDTFGVVSEGRIAPGSGPFNLYVLHEPDWRPPHNDTSKAFGVAAPDRIDR
jgi:hypothetical protein